MLQVKSNAQIDADEKQAQGVLAPADPLTAAEHELAAYIRSCWESAKNHRTQTGLSLRLADNLRRSLGVYSPDKLKAIQDFGGSEAFQKLTGSKIQAAKAWLTDFFFTRGEKIFALDATPVPDLDPSIMQQMIAEAIQVMGSTELGMEGARQILSKHKDRLLQEQEEVAELRMERMSDVIQDRLAETGFRNEFDDFILDFVTYPFAVIKAIEFAPFDQLKWEDDGAGRHVPKKTTKILPRVRRVSPWNFYPSPSATHTLDGHWACEHKEYTRRDLFAMAKVEGQGYITKNILLALADYGTSGLTEWMINNTERLILTGRQRESDSETIDAVEWEGSMQGKRLIDAGVPAEVIGDPLSEHQVQLELIGNYLIRAKLSPDVAGKHSAHVAQWQQVAGSLIGESLPEMISDSQDMCNAIARALQNNVALASGPMTWIDAHLLADGEDITSISPWRTIEGDSSRAQGTSSRKAIEFFQPSLNANELMGVYERFSNYMDDISGLPKYASGSDAGAGAAKTKGGLEMLLNNVSKSLKDRIRNIELNVLEPVITKYYNFEMLTNPDPEIKGDATVRARGSDELMEKDQQAMRAQQLLASTANPIDQQIIGPDGRREQLKEAYKAADVDSSDIVPSKEEFQQRQQQQLEQQAAMAQQGGGNVPPA